MDFEPSEAERRFQEAARDYASSAIAPIAAELDETERFPRELLRGLAERGLMAINVPVELGGAGAGVVAYALAIQEIAYACASTAVMASVTNMVCETIARFGTEPQRRRYCPELARGDAIAGSFALSEPDAGSDPHAMRTTARRDGGGWVIEGTKQWITSGAYAGVLLVWARSSAPGKEGAGISCFLVDGGSKGLNVGRTEDKMGVRASNTVSLEFEGCRVPESALLGTEGGGFKVAMAALDGGRIGIASQSIGIARAALAGSITLAKQQTSGSTRPDHQAMTFALADMQTQIEAAHLLSMRAALRKQQGKRHSTEAAMAKLFASEAAQRVCNAAAQLQGLQRGPTERHLRDARVTTIYEGTSEIQRLVIARNVLGGP